MSPLRLNLPPVEAALSPAPSLPCIYLRSTYRGEPEALLLSLRDHLPECGAWVSESHPGASREVVVGLEVLMSEAWELYALLMSLGLEMTPASHRELCTLCTVCRNRSAPSAGQVIDAELRIAFVECPAAAASCPRMGEI